MLRRLTILGLCLAVFGLVLLVHPAWPVSVRFTAGFLIGFLGSYVFSAVLELLGWERE